MAGEKNRVRGGTLHWPQAGHIILAERGSEWRERIPWGDVRTKISPPPPRGTTMGCKTIAEVFKHRAARGSDFGSTAVRKQVECRIHEFFI